MSTAFLTQQGSAFVSAPANPQPWQQGGGVWVRGVGGQVDVKSNSTTNVQQVPAIANPSVSDAGTINCASKERQTFAGVQVGQDIARLNLDGWNVHLGTTAGYLASRAREQDGAGAFKTDFEVPFVGTYGVVTKGGFFADAMVRGEFYNINLDNPGMNLWNQGFGARGLSITANAGYNVPLQNGWFIEPSAGFTWSRTKVDSFNMVGLPEPASGAELSGTMSIDDIKSEIGRATLRTGTSFTYGEMAWQPFASASVFREFAGNVTGNFIGCQNCAFVNTTPVTPTEQISSTRVGTWGQVSLGMAGQVLNTGWLGFVRGDYRFGSNIEGWTGNAGIRYQFSPELPPAMPKMPVKAPVAPVVLATNWTGFYVGAHLGAGYGTANLGLGTASTDPHVGGVLGGGQAGFNYQVNQFVLGLEGEFSATNLHGSKTCGSATGINPVTGTNTGTFSPFFLNCEDSADWLATLTGRLGVTWDRTLLYVKGGGAWTREDLSVSCIYGPTNGNPLNARNCYGPTGALTNWASATDSRLGWVVGYGTEFALTQNWSAKAEYNYIRFGDHSVAVANGAFLNDKLTVNEVKVGVNYRFSPNLPVLAKY